MPRRPLAPLVVGLLTSLGAAWVLFRGPDAGLADKGDGPRYTCQLDLVAHRFIQHTSAWFTFDPMPAIRTERAGTTTSGAPTPVGSCWPNPS